MKKLEKEVLEALAKQEKKKKYTFSLSPSVKEALARWCEENEVSESGALEQMIKAIIPVKYFE